jgi:hypothetical protein
MDEKVVAEGDMLENPKFFRELAEFVLGHDDAPEGMKEFAKHILDDLAEWEARRN